MKWTPQKRKDVADLYRFGGLTAKQIAARYNVTRGAITNLVRLIGVKVGNKGRGKGRTPPNKGKKFGKPDGTVSVRKVGERMLKYVKVYGKYIPLHRHVYLADNPGFTGKVRFRDGDTLNCELSNLYGISNAKMMQLNAVPGGTLRRKSIAQRAGMKRRLTR